MTSAIKRLRNKSFCIVAGAAVLTSSCGGESSNTPSPAPPALPAPPAPTPSPIAACSLSARQDWALASLDEWYLFPSLLAKSANKAAYNTLDSYIDALTAPARAQNRDRYFTYVTSIKEEDAYYEQGANAGYGFRLALGSDALYVLESYESTPALGANIDRGARITAVGTNSSNLVTISSLLAQGGTEAVVDALGPTTDGTTRVFRVVDASGISREVSLTQTEFNVDPVSDRYGSKIFNDRGKLVGYINLRNFIDTADPDLRSAMADFKAQGVTELIVDLRYNGGGLISIAELFGDLLGRGREGSIFDYVSFRESKASNDQSHAFTLQNEAIAPAKIAFIGTGSTASASEMLINGMVPYLGTNMALIGSNTYGKPVGQIALDRAECDDRLRAIALKVENADRQGEYYNGLAGTAPVACGAQDDLGHPLGDQNEGMIKAALDFLGGRSCGAITASAARVSTPPRKPLAPAQVTRTAQVEMPGSF